VSQIARRMFGTGLFYYLIQASTALILVLAANTSFADFPRLASLLARDRFVPRQFASLGERLVFSNGILVLARFAALQIVIFGGDTHALIPLYAVGVSSRSPCRRRAWCGTGGPSSISRGDTACHQRRAPHHRPWPW
jgi:amino acid transporter